MSVNLSTLPCCVPGFRGDNTWIRRDGIRVVGVVNAKGTTTPIGLKVANPQGQTCTFFFLDFNKTSKVVATDELGNLYITEKEWQRQLHPKDPTKNGWRNAAPSAPGAPASPAGPAGPGAPAGPAWPQAPPSPPAGPAWAQPPAGPAAPAGPAGPAGPAPAPDSLGLRDLLDLYTHSFEESLAGVKADVAYIRQAVDAIGQRVMQLGAVAAPPAAAPPEEDEPEGPSPGALAAARPAAVVASAPTQGREPVPVLCDVVKLASKAAKCKNAAGSLMWVPFSAIEGARPAAGARQSFAILAWFARKAEVTAWLTELGVPAAPPAQPATKLAPRPKPPGAPKAEGARLDVIHLGGDADWTGVLADLAPAYTDPASQAVLANIVPIDLQAVADESARTFGEVQGKILVQKACDLGDAGLVNDFRAFLGERVQTYKANHMEFTAITFNKVWRAFLDLKDPQQQGAPSG